MTVSRGDGEESSLQGSAESGTGFVIIGAARLEERSDDHN
jgi:hypothetical protein